MTQDELKALPKGQFIVMKTGAHPMRTRLRLFLEWGITFGEPYLLPERAARAVAYASRQELEAAILQRHPPKEPKWADPPPGTTVEADLWPDRDQAVELDAARGLRELRRRQEDT